MKTAKELKQDYLDAEDAYDAANDVAEAAFRLWQNKVWQNKLKEGTK